MKNLVFLIPVVGLILAGCTTPDSAEMQAQSAASGKRTVLGRSMDKGQDIATDSNISQINQALAMNKGEDGKPPADINEAKKALKDYPAEMWVDGATGQQLKYHPETGTVSR